MISLYLSNNCTTFDWNISKINNPLELRFLIWLPYCTHWVKCSSRTSYRKNANHHWLKLYSCSPLSLGFMFHSWFHTLVPVPSIRIFWREHCCCRINNNNKDTSYQGWSHPSKNLMVVIMNWLIHMVSVYLN